MAVAYHQEQRTFETGHIDQVHDCQLDFYGKRLATCSSDRKIRIFEISGNSQDLIADLTGHEGPVWQVSWAHPKFGSLLASCGFDGRVIIWQEGYNQKWQAIYTSDDKLHTASVNSVAWAPEEVGLVLASASSDGSIGFLAYNNGKWESTKIASAHEMGALSVTWANPYPAGSLVAKNQRHQSATAMVATGGCDNTIKLWRLEETSFTWVQESTLECHTSWVRCVAWAPNLGLPLDSIASCGQDGLVLVWSRDDQGGEFTPVRVAQYEETAVWSVAWSTMGNMLAVADGRGQVTFWKEQADGQWVQLSETDGSC